MATASTSPRIGTNLVTGLAPGRIKIKQPGMLEQCFLFDGTTVPPLDQQIFNLLDRLVGAVVDFDHDLIDFRPVAVLDALDDVELALLGINLEEVDLVNLVLPDNVRHGCQSALVGRATEPVSGELADVFLHRLARDRFAVQHVPHDRLNGLAVLGFIRMKTGEHRGFFIKGKRRGLGLVRHADVEGPDIRSVGIAVCLQKVIHNRSRFEGINLWVCTAAHHKQRKEPDIGPDIDHRIPVLQADAMPQIALILKNLLVDIVRLILVQMNDFQAVRQNVSRTIPEALLRPFLVEIHERMPIPYGPLLQPQQDDVDPVAVPAKRASRVQQLLKDLVVGRKFDVDRNAEMVAPEFQGILQRLRGKIGGDDEIRCRLFVGNVNAVQKGEGDPGEFQIRLARLVEDPNVAEKTVFVTVTLAAAVWRDPTAYRGN